MKVKPLGEKVLVKRLEAESKTKGGIVLPDTAKEKPNQLKALPSKILSVDQNQNSLKTWMALSF